MRRLSGYRARWCGGLFVVSRRRTDVNPGRTFLALRYRIQGNWADSPCKLDRARTLARESLNQWRVSLDIRLRGEAMHGWHRRPRQLFRSVDFDERLIPIVLVQHGCADIDEEIHPLGVR